MRNIQFYGLSTCNACSGRVTIARYAFRYVRDIRMSIFDGCQIKLFAFARLCAILIVSNKTWVDRRADDKYIMDPSVPAKQTFLGPWLITIAKMSFKLVSSIPDCGAPSWRILKQDFGKIEFNGGHGLLSTSVNVIVFFNSSWRAIWSSCCRTCFN